MRVGAARLIRVPTEPSWACPIPSDHLGTRGRRCQRGKTCCVPGVHALERLVATVRIDRLAQIASLRGRCASDTPVLWRVWTSSSARRPSAGPWWREDVLALAAFPIERPEYTPKSPTAAQAWRPTRAPCDADHSLDCWLIGEPIVSAHLSAAPISCWHFPKRRSAQGLHTARPVHWRTATHPARRGLVQSVNVATAAGADTAVLATPWHGVEVGELTCLKR